MFSIFGFSFTPQINLNTAVLPKGDVDIQNAYAVKIYTYWPTTQRYHGNSEIHVAGKQKLNILGPNFALLNTKPFNTFNKSY